MNQLLNQCQLKSTDPFNHRAGFSPIITLQTSYKCTTAILYKQAFSDRSGFSIVYHLSPSRKVSTKKLSPYKVREVCAKPIHAKREKWPLSAEEGLSTINVQKPCLFPMCIVQL